jgi:hypothetical protein
MNEQCDELRSVAANSSESLDPTPNEIDRTVHAKQEKDRDHDSDGLARHTDRVTMGQYHVVVAVEGAV